MCECVNRCGLVIAIPIGCHFFCQILIYGPIRLKFVIWSPNHWMSIINYMCMVICVVSIMSHTQEIVFAAKS